MEFEFLIKILTSDKPSELIKANEDKLFKIIPELALCKNFNQNNDWHIYDVYDHVLSVVDGVPNNTILRIAALFHDLGKPFTYTEDINGVGHFYAHWNKSKEIFEKFATKYNLNEKVKQKISNIILYHDLNINKMDKHQLTNLINILSLEGINMLFLLKKSDLLAQNPKYHYLLEDIEEQKQKILRRM